MVAAAVLAVVVEIAQPSSEVAIQSVLRQRKLVMPSFTSGPSCSKLGLPVILG